MIVINVDGSNDLYQWDTNRSVVISGVDPSNEYQIHFKNVNMDSVIVKNATANSTDTVTARIPNELLQSEFPITLYIYGKIGDTVRTFTTSNLKVNPRPKPSDYVLPDDEDEAFNYITLLAKLNAVIDEISKTYATKKDLSDGKVTVHKAVCDQQGNPIHEHYVKIESLENEMIKVYGRIIDLSDEIQFSLLENNKKVIFSEAINLCWEFIKYNATDIEIVQNMIDNYDKKIGDIDTAIDSIIAIQNELLEEASE